MTTDLPDPSLYARAPLMSVEAGIALCRTLVAAKSKSVPNSVKKAATKLGAVADAAQNALALRQKELVKVSDDDARVIDQAGDGSWGALRMRIEACSMLPASNPDSKRAAELLMTLFGQEGLSWLKLTYAEQWATADTILRRIDQDGLQKDIDHLAGPAFLAHVRQHHAVYGNMVQALMRRDESTTVNLNDHVRSMGRAIVDYATKVLATVDEDEPDTITSARDALRPLDAYREAAARRNPKSSTTPDPAPAPSSDSSG
ncbi:MAG TPA: hypothetical protein PK156_02255 [Polyangium sp.]|nr:hypothetical protein [Polyangium sp.]